MKTFQAAFLILFLISCSSNQTVSSTATRESLLIPSPIPTQTLAPPTETLTPTSTPAPAVSSAPSWTPFPTYPPDAGLERLRTWLQGTFDCLLPCWGGITPGQTSWQEAKQLLEQMSGFSTVKASEGMSCEFGICNGVAWSLYPGTVAEGVFYTKLPENTVHMIHINLQNEGTQKTNLLRNVGLQDVFRWYGSPPVLLFNVESDSQGDKFLEIIMVYPERQFIIKYVRPAEIDGDNLVNCVQDSHIELIILDNKEQLMSPNKIASAVETKGLHVDATYKPVEEATGMTLHSFYLAFSTFNNRNAPCISTPISLWLP